MTETIKTELDARFSDEDAAATPWEEGRDRLADASIYWLTTVRPDGRPHMTPLIGVWLDDAMHFCTGVSEQQGPQPRDQRALHREHRVQRLRRGPRRHPRG